MRFFLVIFSLMGLTGINSFSITDIKEKEFVNNLSITDEAGLSDNERFTINEKRLQMMNKKVQANTQAIKALRTKNIDSLQNEIAALKSQIQALKTQLDLSKPK